MQKRTNLIIVILLIWNIILSLLLYQNKQREEETENKVRNIYNKTTSISYEELTEPGTRWGFHGRDMED